MKKSKKMNTYLKYAILLLCSALAGGLIAFVMMEWGLDMVLANISPAISRFVDVIRTNILWCMAGLLIVEVIAGEITLGKLKKLAVEGADAEDEEGDRIEYEMEKAGAIGTGILSAIAFVGIVALSTGYSIEYIKMLDVTDAVGICGIPSILLLIAAFLVFMLVFVYQGYWSVRLVKMQQKLDPKKKGDPTSIKFTEQWVESCDEAEKELIYQSAFKSYTLMMNWTPVLTMIALFMHMFWDTGITAVIFTGIIWLMVTVSYLKNCVVKRKQKLIR